MTLEDWKSKILILHPTARFVLENGKGSGYGRRGDWTALIGPSPLTDAVGVYTAEGDSVCAEGTLRARVRS